MARNITKYIVGDGKAVLYPETAEEGGDIVTSPFDPGLVTEAETLESAFVMARDAANELRQARTQTKPCL